MHRISRIIAYVKVADSRGNELSMGGCVDNRS